MNSRRARMLVLPVALASILATAGCSGDAAPVAVPALNVTTVPAPVFDPTLQPAATVMAVVPATAVSLGVTDFTQVRLDVGLGDVTSASSAADRAELERRAARTSDQLSDVVLRPVDAVLRSQFGFGADDVAWQAQWSGPDGDGLAIALRADVPAAGPVKAAAAGVGPLAGSTYYPTTHVFLRGGTLDPTTSWRADPDLTDLVGQVAASTYVHRGCLPLGVAFKDGVVDPGSGSTSADVASLTDIPAFSVSLGARLATVQLGPLRPDVFVRSRLSDYLPRTAPEFGRAFTAPVVADPQGGRIGYGIGDARTAASLVVQQQLPFAVCPSS